MTWKSGPSLIEARAGATVSVLRDKRILIAGGDTSAGVSDSMEIYDALTGGFSQVQSKLSSPRREHSAAVLADGRVLIAGGFDGSQALDTADLFDPQSGRVASAGKLNVPRAGLTATTLLGGRVLIAGGSNGKTEIGAAELYDPKSGEFKLEASLMITPRRDHAAVRIPGNNTVVLVGGTLAGQPLSRTETYIPWRHRFQAAGDMQFAKTGMIAGSLKRAGKLMIAGGRNAAGMQANAETISLPTIATDKADYAPGTPVVFSGSGWLPNQPVKIVMVESPDIDRPDAITTIADADGNVSDSSFAPDEMDIGITFYVTATQQGPLDGNGQATILTAQTSFTDAANLKFSNGTGNTCDGGSNQYQSAAAAAPFGQPVCASASGLGNGTASVTVVWVQPGTSTPFSRTVSLSNGVFQDIQTPNAAGQWTVNVYSDPSLTTLLGSGTFFVSPFSGRLRFTTTPFAITANTCSPANTIQIQDAAGTAFSGLTFSTKVNLSTSSAGTFYSDSSCTAAIASVQIPVGQSNTPNFYYKDGATGTPTLTGAAAESPTVRPRWNRSADPPLTFW